MQTQKNNVKCLLRTLVGGDAYSGTESTESTTYPHRMIEKDIGNLIDHHEE